MDAIWIVPPALGLIGVAGYAMAALLSRRFDRQYPHLSRKALQDAEELERAALATARRPPVPVPPFHIEEWQMQSVRRDLDSERVDRSLAHLGEQVARHPVRPDVSRGPAERSKPTVA